MLTSSAWDCNRRSPMKKATTPRELAVPKIHGTRTLSRRPSASGTAIRVFQRTSSVPTPARTMKSRNVALRTSPSLSRTRATRIKCPRPSPIQPSSSISAVMRRSSYAGKVSTPSSPHASSSPVGRPPSHGRSVKYAS